MMARHTRDSHTKLNISCNSISSSLWMVAMPSCAAHAGGITAGPVTRTCQAGQLGIEHGLLVKLIYLGRESCKSRNMWTCEGRN